MSFNLEIETEGCHEILTRQPTLFSVAHTSFDLNSLQTRKSGRQNGHLLQQLKEKNGRVLI